MSLQQFQQRISIKLIVFILVCLFVNSIYAEIIVVNVGGGGPNNLKFIPQNVTAHKGDTILWKFVKGNHDVVESNGIGSCEESTKVNAFKSATNPLSGEFNITIDGNDDIITYMCLVGEGSHCANGMWGVIFVEPAHSKSPVNHTGNDTENEKNNPGKIAGVVIGSVLGLISIAALGFLSYKRYRSNQMIKRTSPTAEQIKPAGQNTQDTKDEVKIVEHA